MKRLEVATASTSRLEVFPPTSSDSRRSSKARTPSPCFREQKLPEDLPSYVSQLRAALDKSNRNLHEALQALRQSIANEEAASDRCESFEKECLSLTGKLSKTTKDLMEEQARSRELESRLSQMEQQLMKYKHVAQQREGEVVSLTESSRSMLGRVAFHIRHIHGAAQAVAKGKKNLRGSVLDFREGMNREFANLKEEMAKILTLHNAQVAQKGVLAAQVMHLQVALRHSQAEKGKEEAAKVQYFERYKREAAERRAVYNKLQELRGNIRVYCRMRPLPDTPGCITSSDDYEVHLLNPETNENVSYEFDRVYGPTATQQQIFEDTQPLITSVLDGYNVCIFAYGQTGSGKTYTMVGPVDNRGVNFRALTELVKIANSRQPDYKYDMHVTMLEIYNDDVRDLLRDTSRPASKLELVHGSHGIYVPSAFKINVSTVDDILNVMTIGNVFRAMAPTEWNAHSSRSHTILTVFVTGRNVVTEVEMSGKLSLVDLAGSEVITRAGGASDMRLLEASHINNSLSAIADVLTAVGNKEPNIPYGKAKLTELLQDSLGGDSKTLMFLHLHPSKENVGEVLRSLQFGTKVSQVELGQAKQHVADQGHSPSK